MADEEAASREGGDAGNGAVTTTATAGGAASIGTPPDDPGARVGRLGPSPFIATGFLLPAVVLLAALVAYPIVYTVWRSLFNASGGHFVGLHNYVIMFTDSQTFTAVKNNVIWVLLAPVIVTALGLIFAVLTERVRWATAFKLVVFMPMAISMVAVGVIFTLVYNQDPSQGVLNAAITGVNSALGSGSQYPGAHIRDDAPLTAQGSSYVTKQTVGVGQTAALPLVGLAPTSLPKKAAAALQPAPIPGAIDGTVWLDFKLGGGGTPNQVGPGKRGLPGVKIQAVQGTKVVASATSKADGTFVIKKLKAGSYTLRLPSSNFAQPYRGVSWLGPDLVTPSIIGAYIWMWAGFAMVLIAAGLAAIPRDALEAARVDGATEWQVFRRVTMPLLAPVLIVVLVTLIINVLKIFDLVFIIAPGATQQNANVLALQMYLKSFGGGNDQGLGSAIAIFLFVLVLPAMIFNIRRFRRDQA